MNHVEDRRIKVRIDPELAEIIPDFFNFRQRDLELIKDYVIAGDLEKLKYIGHNLKGAGGGFGFDAISSLGARIEKAAEEGRIADIDTCAGELADYLSRVDVHYA